MLRLSFIKWQNNPKYDNLSQFSQIADRGGGGGGGGSNVSISLFLRLPFEMRRDKENERKRVQMQRFQELGQRERGIREEQGEGEETRTDDHPRSESALRQVGSEQQTFDRQENQEKILNRFSRKIPSPSQSSPSPHLESIPPSAGHHL